MRLVDSVEGLDRPDSAARLEQLCESVLSRRPLILVSNRGPVEHQMTPEGRPEARRGSGSVVTAFNSLSQKYPFTWVSSAMGEGDRVISNNGQGRSLKSPLPGHQINLRYVVTPRRVYHKYYNILCNPLLWFLQHYMWNPPYNPTVDASVHDAWEGGYVPVNQASPGPLSRKPVSRGRRRWWYPTTITSTWYRSLYAGNSPKP